MQNETLCQFSKEFSKELISFHDPTGTFEAISHNVTNILGYEPDDLIGKSIYNFIHTEDKEFFEIIIHLPILSGSKKTLSADIRFRKKDGEYAWLNMDIMPVKDENGIITNINTFYTTKWN